MRYMRAEETDLGSILESINRQKMDELQAGRVRESVNNLKRLDDFYSASKSDWYIK